MVGFLSRVILVLFYPVKLLEIIVKSVITQFMFHPEQHEKGTCETDGKTGYIDKGDSFLF